MDVRVVLAGIIFVFPCFCRTGQDSGEQSSGYLHLKNTTRVKRVFFGEPLLEENSYNVTRYIVFITNGQCGSNFWSRLKHRIYGLCDPPTVNWLQCGGSLISEYTVQTACHCIVYWTLLNDTHFKGNPRTVWEDQFVMYAGNFDVAQMKDGSRAITFIHHQKCMKVRSDVFKGLPGEGGHITYDFGIIFGRTPLIKKYNFVVEAPTYAVSELRRLYEKIQYDESVCLLVGWGHAKVVEDAKKLYKKGLSISSQYLQHTWNRVMSYCDCAASHSSLTAFLERTGLGRQDQKYSYKEFASWFCVKKFGKMTGVSGHGDSGSPVTCDNRYMGLISQGES